MPDSDFPSGVFAASLTPFVASGAVDVPAFTHHVQWLLHNGCDGVLLFGTTGEGFSLSASERIDTLAALLGNGIPAERLIVGTGAGALPDAVQMTRRATDQGVAGVLVLPPFHFREIPDDGVFRFYDQLIRRTGRDTLHLYFYHYPELSGVPVAFPVIQRLLEAHPKQVVGIKDSSGEWDHTEALIRSFPDLNVFAGTERLLLPALQAGGAGCISATANVTAPLAQQVVEAWRSGADAASLQDTLSSLRGSLVRFPTIAALKQACAWRARGTMNAAVRPPLVRLDAKTRDALRPVHARIQSVLGGAR